MRFILIELILILLNKQLNFLASTMNKKMLYACNAEQLFAVVKEGGGRGWPAPN